MNNSFSMEKFRIFLIICKWFGSILTIGLHFVAFWKKSSKNCTKYSRPPIKKPKNYRAFQIRCARKVYGKNSLINKAYFLVYFNFSTRTKIYINDFLLYHELFINKVGSSWQLQQAPNHEKVAFLQGSPLNSPFLVEFLEPF